VRTPVYNTVRSSPFVACRSSQTSVPIVCPGSGDNNEIERQGTSAERHCSCHCSSPSFAQPTFCSDFSQLVEDQFASMTAFMDVETLERMEALVTKA